MNNPCAPQTTLTPGKYWVWLGRKAKPAEVFEDVDAGCLVVRFDGVDRCQRIDEIDPDCTFSRREANGASRGA